MATGSDAWLVKRARSPEDAQALLRFNRAMALPLLLAAVLPLLLTPDSDASVLAAAVNIAAWVVFLVDLVVHQRRLHGYLATWLGRFDVLVVVLTAPWFLLLDGNGSRFVVVVRLARLARLVVAGAGARRLMERLGRVAVVAAAVVFVGAAAAYGAEHPVNPEFSTYGEALWWAAVTLATVGYGDIVPETTGGRLVGVMVMITGLGVLGVLAGSLASALRLDGSSRPGTEPPPSPGPPAPAGAGGADAAPAAVAELVSEVADLRREVARLADRLDGRPGGADPSDPAVSAGDEPRPVP